MTFPRMVGAEWRKAKGRGLAWAVLLYGAVQGVFAVLALWGTGRAADAMQEGASEGFDWLLAADAAAQFASLPIHGLGLLVFFAIVWAEDLSQGTAAMILVRPVRRVELFSAKLVLCFLVALAGVVLATGFGAVLGLALFGTEGDPSMYPLPSSQWIADVEGLGGRLLRIAYGALLAAVVMLPALAVAALTAVVTRSPLLTLAGSIVLLCADAGAWAILWAWSQTEIAGAEQMGELREWTLWASRDLLEHHGTLTTLSDGLPDLGRTIGYSLTMLACAAAVLQYRDIR